MSAGEGNVAFSTRKQFLGTLETPEKGRRSNVWVIFSVVFLQDIIEKPGGVLEVNLLMLGYVAFEICSAGRVAGDISALQGCRRGDGKEV